MSWLIVGLGNPGAQYEGNRHNIGFMVIDELSRRAVTSFRTKFNSNHTKIRLGNEDAHLLQPMTYMNRSGTSVGAAATFFKVEAERTIVVHDELDIPAGENDAVHTETFRNWTDRPMTIVSMTLSSVGRRLTKALLSPLF